MNGTITRQAAYDTLTEYYHHKTDVQHEALREALSRVPGVGQTEVIRCKDCKYWKIDHTCKEHSLVSPMKANEFCSRAERQEE